MGREVAEQHEGVWARDRVANLVVRLRHNVIRAGLRRINLAYWRISLAGIASKLGVPLCCACVRARVRVPVPVPMRVHVPVRERARVRSALVWMIWYLAGCNQGGQAGHKVAILGRKLSSQAAVTCICWGLSGSFALAPLGEHLQGNVDGATRVRQQLP